MVTINDIGNQKTVSIDRVANAPSSLQWQIDQLHNSANQQSVPMPRKKKDEEEAAGGNEYVFE